MLVSPRCLTISQILLIVSIWNTAAACKFRRAGKKGDCAKKDEGAEMARILQRKAKVRRRPRRKKQPSTLDLLKKPTARGLNAKLMRKG
jgi:hypothetical protein